MTESQAWKKVAAWFHPRHYTKCKDKWCYVANHAYAKGGNDGICGALGDITRSNYRLYYTMISRLPLKRDDFDYAWPRTRRGHRARRAFALKMARKTAKKKTVTRT